MWPLGTNSSKKKLKIRLLRIPTAIQEVASAIMNHLVLPDSQFTQKMVNEYDALTAVSEVLKKLASQPPATKDASYNSSVENCILVLGNIAVGSKSLKRAVLDSDATETILKILVGVFTVRISRAAVWALQSFLRGGHETPCVRITSISMPCKGDE